MREKSVIIIGAGIGGLATGCYAQANGYRTRILEMHTTPGGVCTSWTRNGFTFDGCIHNLAGSHPTSPLHKIWQELGVVPDVPMHAYKEMVRVERVSGEPLKVYTDLEKLERVLMRLSPADAETIAQLLRSARKIAGFDILGLAAATSWERMKALTSAIPLLIKFGGTTLEAFASRFKDPFLREAFPRLIYDWPQQSMLMLLSFLAALDRGDLGWPVGGSAALARAIERRFVSLGGEILYQTKVKSILIDNNRAVGVTLSDGSEQRADIVISNGYGPATIFDMLAGRYTSRAIRNYYATPEDRVEMGLHVGLGVARSFPEEPHAIVLTLDPPVEIDQEVRHTLYVQIFGHDGSFAPAGKSVLKVLLPTSYSRWSTLHRAPHEYQAAKEGVAQAVIAQLAKRFEGIERQIEVVDVATPMTFSGYTGNGRGFKFSINRMMLALFAGRKLSQTLPGLENFYMVGQWAGMPGVSLVAAMGRDVVRQMCKRDGRPFVTSRLLQSESFRPLPHTGGHSNIPAQAVDTSR
jgi:phytoene dehydrogenase-like protein